MKVKSLSIPNVASFDSASDPLFCDLQACKYTSSGAADSERKWLADLTTVLSVDFVAAVTQAWFKAATMSEAILSEKDIRRAEILRAKREKFEKERQLLSRLSPRAIAEATRKLAVKLQCFGQDRLEEPQLAVTKASPAPPKYAATPLATPDARCSPAAAPTTSPAADNKNNDGLETRLDSHSELDLPSPTFTCCLLSPGSVDDKGIKGKILSPRQLKTVKETAREKVPRNQMEGKGVREGASPPQSQPQSPMSPFSVHECFTPVRMPDTLPRIRSQQHTAQEVRLRSTVAAWLRVEEMEGRNPKSNTSKVIEVGEGEKASRHRHELTLSPFSSESVSSEPSAARKERLAALEPFRREKREESERGVTERVVPLVSALFEEKERERTRQAARERDLRTRKSPVEAALHSAHSSTPTPTTPRSTATSISPRHQGPSPTSKALLRHQGGTPNLRALSSTPPGA